MAYLCKGVGAPRVWRRATALIISAGALGAVVATATPLPQPDIAHAASVVDVVAWAPTWDTPDSLTAFNANSAQMSELTPLFWAARSATIIGKVGNSPVSDAKIAEYKAAAAAAGKPIVATIADGMAARGMQAVIVDPVTRAQHVQALVSFASAGGYSGIELDYEQFAFSDGKATWPVTFDAWGALVKELSEALHAVSKTLSVAVPPIYNSAQDANSGYWVYNYPEMAKYVDRIRVMTYSYSVSSAGPIGPYNWVSSSMDAALAIVPAGKLVMGIPAYGNDWVVKTEGTCPTGVTVAKTTVRTDDATAKAAAKGLKPGWDPVTRERTYTYVDSFSGNDPKGNFVRCNVTRTAWYLDADAIYERIMLAQAKGLAGVAIWALNYTDSFTWDGIAAARSGNLTWQAPPVPEVTPRPAPLPPITSPTSPLPARFLDTRAGAKTTDGQYAGKGAVEGGQAIEVQIAGRGTVPADAEAVTLNVTAIGEGSGFVTVYPCGTRPVTSSLNIRTGQIISNSVITRLSPNGSICLFTLARAQLLFDVFNVLPAATFAPVDAPARLLDTRAGLPTIDGLSAGGGAMAPGSILEIQIAGRGGLPADARAAVLNVTADGAVGPGFLTVWPCNSTAPTTSNVNYPAAAPIPNAVVTGLSPTGTVCVLSSNRTNVIIDVFGQLRPDEYKALTQPARIVDTRVGGSTNDGEYSGGGIQPAGSVIELQVGGRVGLAANAKTVVLNVTVDGPTANGFVTVYPCESGRPLVSNVNFAPGQTLPNLVVAKLSTAGTVCIFNQVPTHIVVDVFGALNV